MDAEMPLGVCGAATFTNGMTSAPTSTDALVELLSKMKAEAERNARAIDALDRRSIAGAEQLSELLAHNERAEADLVEIEQKASTSAGAARAHAEVLSAEQRCVARLSPQPRLPAACLSWRPRLTVRPTTIASPFPARHHAWSFACRERVSLDAEAQRLEETLTQSATSLERWQMQSVAQHAELASEIPALRCAFRKRTRDGHSNALRMACSLTTLETEMGLLGGMGRLTKPRTAWASPAF